MNSLTIDTLGRSSVGAVARNSGSLLLDRLSVVTSNDLAVGLRSESGGQIRIGGRGIIETKGTDADGMQADGVQSAIIATDRVAVSTAGVGSSGVVVRRGARVELADLGVITSGDLAHGAVVSDGGMLSIADLDASLEGMDAYGLSAGSGGRIELSGSGLIQTTGGQSFGLYSSDVDSLITASGPLTINTSGSGSSAVVGRQNGRMILADVTAVMTADEDVGAVGVHAQSQSHITVSKLNVQIGATPSAGVAAEFGSVLDLTDLEILMAGDGSFGAVALGGGIIGIDGVATLTTTGASAYGVVAEGADSALTSTLSLGITTSGSGSVAALVRDSAALSVNGLSVATSGDDAGGVYALSGGTANIKSVQVRTLGRQAHGLSAQDGGSLVVANYDVITTGAGAAAISLNGANRAVSAQLRSGELESKGGPVISLTQGSATLDMFDSHAHGTGLLFDVGGVSAAHLTVHADNTILNGAGRTGADSHTEMHLRNGSIWHLLDASNLTELRIENSAIFFDPKPDSTTLHVSGDYVADDAFVRIHTKLGDDSSPTHLLVVGGNTSGKTTLSVVNKSGLGAVTSEGITVVKVGGVSDGYFSLAPDYLFEGNAAIVGGAFAYQLYKGNRSATETNHWYLRSEAPPVPEPEPQPEPEPTPEPFPAPPPEPQPQPDPVPEPQPQPQPQPEPPPSEPEEIPPLYQPGVPLYEAYPQALLNLNGLATLQQRKGNRSWAKGDGAAGQFSSPSGSEAGWWTRAEGGYTSLRPRISTSNSRYRQGTFELQAGLDHTLIEAASGALVGEIGLNAAYGKMRVRSRFGNGDITTEGVGLSGALTWYGTDGFYVDAQAKGMFYRSDIRSRLVSRNMTARNDATGYAASVEAGRIYHTPSGWDVTPQAQLVYSRVKFDGFDDVFNAHVTMGRGSEILGRLGVAISKASTWMADNGRLSRAHYYGIANLNYDMSSPNYVTVSAKRITSAALRTGAELGVGGSYSWSDNRYSLYGQAAIGSLLDDLGHSNEVKGQIGLKMSW